MTDQQAFRVAILALLSLALSVGLAIFLMGGGRIALLVYALALVVIVVGAAI